MKLGDIISLKALQEIQDCFTEATGFAAITVDYKGQPLLRYSNFSSFCSKIRENAFYNERCHLSDAHGSIEAVRRGAVCIYRCHAGLVDFAIPIIVDGNYVASMMCGQVLVENSEEVDAELMKPSSNLYKDYPELTELYKKLPVLPFNRIKETANLLYLTLNYIGEQYLLNQKNLRLLSEQKDKLELEKMLNEMEYKFYSSQVNPHFLFNCLNIAGRQAYLENAEKTQEIIYALADIYRTHLTDADQLITISKEMNNVDNYIFIQKIRFGEQLKFESDLSEEIRTAKLPTMTLQIFVENAIRHGLEKKEDLGFVKLRGYVNSSGQICFEISDNGVGIPRDVLHMLKAKNFPPAHTLNSRGIYNVHKRLNYFFQDNYELSFESDKNGTCVKLTIPETYNED